MAVGRLDQNNDNDVFTFIPQVDHLGRFEGSTQVDMDGDDIVPALWNIDGRPASRITIAVEFELSGSRRAPSRSSLRLELRSCPRGL